MSSTKALQIVLAARPKGKATLADFRLEENEIPTPSPGQVLLRVHYLSLDPYMRGQIDDRESYSPPTPLGNVMPGESVARVVASNHPDYSTGDIVLAHTGWRTHALSDGADLRKLDSAIAPVTTALGVLGMPGFTAFSGLCAIGKPQPGETVVVAAASGPVGSLVGQLTKFTGARAVGIVGGPEKCACVKDELGFDAAVDHKAADFAAQLAAVCPDGIDARRKRSDQAAPRSAQHRRHRETLAAVRTFRMDSFCKDLRRRLKKQIAGGPLVATAALHHEDGHHTGLRVDR